MAMKRIILLLILMTLTDSGSSQCSCYSFDGVLLRSWIRARKLCTANNGDLVSMETVEEWEFIKSQIQYRTTKQDGHNEWWIGLEKRDGKWEWLSNHNLTYNKWQYNKPNDRDKISIHVIMAKNYPEGYYGLFRNKRDYLQRGTICEYKGQENCGSRDSNTLSWCYTTAEPPSRSTITITSIPSQTTKIIHTITETTGNYSSALPHHSTSSFNGPVEESTQSFPTTIVGTIIGVLLLTTCLVILACIWKRRKQERKPRRNSHLGKKSRVPVKLEHSLAYNANDFINSTDVTVARDNSLQQESTKSVDDHKTGGTCKEPVPVYASVGRNQRWEHQQTDTNQSNTSHVIYAELNEPQRAVNQSSYHGNKEPDSITYENELTDDQNGPNAHEGIEPEFQDNRLVYAQLAEFKDSEQQQQSSTKMPSPYEATEYATIMKPILSNRAKSKENITQI